MDNAASQCVRNGPSWARDGVTQVPVPDGCARCSYLAMPGNTSDGELWNPPDAETCKTCPPALSAPAPSLFGAGGGCKTQLVQCARPTEGSYSRGAKGRSLMAGADLQACARGLCNAAYDTHVLLSLRVPGRSPGLLIRCPY